MPQEEQQQKTSDSAEPEDEVGGEPPGFYFFLVHVGGIGNGRMRFDAQMAVGAVSGELCGGQISEGWYTPRS